MAMLAERKQKQKWSLNPRGKEWSEDSNKFGQKMLEKMGWKSGKGLGTKLDGVTEHIKVSHKHDNKGMGYKETEQWTQHDENFTKLLNSLAENCSVENIDSSPKSLEQISANSKKRVHYHKFTRSKDLSQYSEKQLANIFGKKALKPKSDDGSESNEISIESDNNKNTKKYGVDTLEGGSMVDYFQNKFGRKFVCNNDGFEIGYNGVLRKVKAENRNSDCEFEYDLHRPSFGFGFQENSELIEEEGSKINSDENNSSAKKNKKRKLNKNVNQEVYENTMFNGSLNDGGEDCQAVVENPYEVKPKKKKVKIDVSNENVAKQSDEKLSRKKKSKKCDVNSDISAVIAPEEKIIKIKKKKNNKISPINDEETNIPVSIETNVIKRKKSRKNPQNEENSFGNTADLVEKQMTDNSELNKQETPLNKTKLNKTIEQTTFDEYSTKKKTKKRKKMGLQNPNFDVNESGNSFVDANSEFEVKRKNKEVRKNKTLENSGLDNPGLNVSNLTDGEFDRSYEEGLSISAQQNLDCGFENLALNISKNDSIGACASDVIQCDLMLNVAGLPSSAQNTRIERRKSVRFAGVNQQYIIPNNYENKLMEQKFEGLANAAFDERAATMEENMMDMEQQLSTDCARVENDLNEVRAAAHARLFVPIVPLNSGTNIYHGNAGIRSLPVRGNSGGGRIIKQAPQENTEDFPEIGEKDHLEANQVTPNGDVRLSYKLATLKVTNVPHYLRGLPKNTDRASYKHLVKGDIILGFKKTNLHQISGYGNEEIVNIVEGN